MSPTFLWASLQFLNSISSLFFELHNLYWSIFKFTDPFAIEIYCLRPSDKFFISFIMLFNFRIFYLVILIVSMSIGILCLMKHCLHSFLNFLKHVFFFSSLNIFIMVNFKSLLNMTYGPSQKHFLLSLFFSSVKMFLFLCVS